MPEQESLRQLAGHGCSLAVYLSAGHVERLQEELADLPPDTVVICAHQVGWPEEKIVRATTATLVATVKEHALDSHTLFLILPGERQDAPPSASRLYAPDFSHARRVGTES
jgi:precorrin-4/cobalt-precorrin-4 C11-methyltransferase